MSKPSRVATLSRPQISGPTGPTEGVDPPRRQWARGFGSLAGRTALRILILAAFVGLWWFVVRLGLWSELILPSPAAVWDAFVESVTVHDGRKGIAGYYLWEHLWASLWRIARGLFWGIVVGIPLGVALATITPFRFVVEPFVNFVRSLPPLAYFSLLLIWFGIDDTSKVWLLFLAAFAPIAIATMAGVESVSSERIDAARSLGANRLQVVVHTVLPASLPDVFTGIRLALGFAWTTIVAAETANGIPGIGGLAWATKRMLRTDVAILCVLVIGITAVLLDLAIRGIERLVVPWKGRG